jgi:hypothetical protein
MSTDGENKLNSKGGPNTKNYNEFHIGTVGKIHQGDVYGGSQDTISFLGTFVLKLDEANLGNCPRKYSDAIEDLAKKLNEQFMEEKVTGNTAIGIQDEMNKLLEESCSVTEQSLDENKKRGIRDRLKSLAISIVKVSPKIAEVVATCTPLAPFSKIIGETFDNIIKEVLAKRI